MTGTADWSSAKTQQAIDLFVNCLEERLVEAGLDHSHVEDTGPIDWTVAGGRNWDAKREVTVTDLDANTARELLDDALRAGMTVNWKARDSVSLDGPYETVELWCPMTVRQLCFQVAAWMLENTTPESRDIQQRLVQWATSGEFADHSLTESRDVPAQECLTTMLTDRIEEDFGLGSSRRILLGHVGGNLARAITHVLDFDMVTAARLLSNDGPAVRVPRRDAATGGPTLSRHP